MTDLCGTCRTCRHSETMWSQEPCNSCGVGRENFEPDRAVRLEDVQEDVIPMLPIPECKPVKESDPVSHPNHYCQGGIECKDAIRAAVIGLTGFEAYCTGNIIKYCWRWYHKNGVEDLRKAKTYIDFLIEEVTNK